jgi:hypothetical protein
MRLSAGLHALAASHAGALAHRVVQVKHNLAVRSAHGVTNDVIDLFAAGARSGCIEW